MLEIKGYITNLGKYNEGALIGKWIDFPIDEDELQTVLKEIGCCYYDENEKYINTGYEEFFFSDWECDFDHNFGEYENIENMNEIAENIANWDEDIFSAAVEIWSVDEVLNNDINDYMLLTNVSDDYDLGEYYAVECCCINFGKDTILERYFDFNAFGRDIRLETNGGFSSYGWIEYRN